MDNFRKLKDNIYLEYLIKYKSGFLFAMFLRTLSNSICLAVPVSILSRAIWTSLLWDIVHLK